MSLCHKQIYLVLTMRKVANLWPKVLVESFQECGFSIFIDNVFITMEAWPQGH